MDYNLGWNHAHDFKHEFDLKSQVLFLTKIARHQVQLPLYYIHFEITSFLKSVQYVALGPRLFRKKFNDKIFCREKKYEENERSHDLLIGILSYDEVYLGCLPRTTFADQGPLSTVAFSRITSNMYTCKFGTGSFMIIMFWFRLDISWY